MNIAVYAKAIVPLVVAGVVAALAVLGVTPDMNVKDAITLIITLGITSIGVYYTPNKKAGK